MSITDAQDRQVPRAPYNGRRDISAVLLLLVSGVAWPVLVSALSCSLSIPRNDAFAYSRIAETLAHDGIIHLIGYGRMSLLGQIFLAQPLYWLIDDRELAGNVFGITMMSITIVLSYTLARRFLSPWQSILVTLTLIFVPGLANTTPTFMTEPIFLCLTVATLLAAVLAYESPTHAVRWMILSAVLGIAAFTVREFGIIAPIAAIAAIVLTRRISRIIAACLAGFVLLSCVAFYLWHQHLSGLESTALHLHLRAILLPVRAVFTLGFCLLPVTLRPALALLRSPGRLTIVGAIVVVLLALPRIATGNKLFLEDMLRADGVSGEAVLNGVRPILVPGPEWILLNAIALVGGVCLVVVIIDLVRRRVGERDQLHVAPLEAFVVAYAGLTGVYGTFANMLDDRYVWPLVLPVAIIVVGRSWQSAGSEKREIPWLAVAPLLMLVVISTTLNQDAAAYDGARWGAAQELLDAGASSSEIDGGLEWEGAHSRAIADLSGRETSVQTPSHPYYEGFWAPAERCFVVSNSLPELDGKLLGTRSYRSQLGLSVRALYIWARPGETCGAQVAALRPIPSTVPTARWPRSVN